MKQVLTNPIPLVVILAIFLSGCGANFHSIYRDTSGDENKVAFTDAKQSATIINVKDGIMRACAAKSPDVFQALSTAVSGDLTVEEAHKLSAALSGAGSTAESAAAFGLRTQLTQSQSELLYQLCINSLNGTISSDQLATELHRYQNTMVTMLAIEQVTGYARATVAALGGTAQTGNTDAVGKLQENLNKALEKEDALMKAFGDTTTSRKTATASVETAKALVETKQNSYDDLKKKLDTLKAADPKSKPEDIAAADKAVTTADTELGKAKNDLDKAQSELETDQIAEKNASSAYKEQIDRRKNIEKSLAAVKNSHNTSAQSAVPVISDNYSAVSITNDIADKVLEMQKVHLHQTFTTDECLHFLFHPESRDKKLSPGEIIDLESFCKAHLNEVNNYSKTALYLENGCALSGSVVTCASQPNLVRPHLNDIRTFTLNLK